MTARANPAPPNGQGRRPRALLFDWDNTLVDSWPAIHAATNATFQEFGLPTWTLDETRARVRRSLRESFPILFGDRWRDAARFYYDAFTAIHLDLLRPRPGAEEMLIDLAAQGVYLAVVSNKTGEVLRIEARHLGWDRHFRRLVGATDAPRDKPAVEPVELALDGSGIVRGAAVWFVGDTDIDLTCARNADCLPVLVRDHPPATDEFPDGGPALYFADCRALSNLIRSL